MNLKERIKELCAQRGISMNKLEESLGFGKGYISKLGSSTPNASKIKKIADYFSVSLDYLMEGEPDQKDGLTAKDERDIKKDLDSIMDKISSKADGPASYDGEELSPESLELFRGELEIALKRLKLINKEKYNPHKND